ncbi:thiamine phosphate synthase [Niallia endozanthoxylica]|uniref:Thiamine phosphate synthase n=1 Tax=Niallia endozanthoxylica TaxID=2036016 RepID=A0A5J5HMK2_9BACI|nr:thiamine phosphate synthase [Niallia endozanthoxylica]KAA9022582.1 thiamine phosphate synthase [Niallia endozanthoxylica]
MLILVTNRKLCKQDFLAQIDQLAKGKPHSIMLREKDLELDEYEALAIQVNDICKHHNVPLIINQNISVANKLRLTNIQLSMENLRKYQCELQSFNRIGASVHSAEEAKEAVSLGATHLIAGHVFSTDSKKRVPPRGISFLKDVCDSVNIPVFAIGGIKRYHVKEILATGAKGYCIMSEAMTSPHPVRLANDFHS